MKTNESRYEKPDFLEKLTAYALIFISVVMLIYCERGTRGLTKASTDMTANYVELTDTTNILPENDGKMVYFGAFEKADGPVFDPLYGVGGNYLAISRIVEYYQWVEVATTTKYKHKNDDNREETVEETEYSYNRAWVREPVDSKGFYDSMGHENTAPLVIDACTKRVGIIKMGAYNLGDPIRKNATDRLEETLEHGVDMATAHKPLAKASAPMDVHLLGKEIYYGKNPEHPQIGDVRVEFLATKPSFMYILAKVDKESLVPYHVSELSEDMFNLAPEPFDTSYYLEYDTEGAGYLMIVIRIIAWLLIVWAVHDLRGNIVYPLREKRLTARIIPKEDNKLTLWAVGTYLSVVVIVICHIFSRMTT